MSLSGCVQAAMLFPKVTVQTTQGPLPLGMLMVAIAGAESSWNDLAQGDPLSIYPDGGTAEAPYSCSGKTSEGLWQINMPAHWPYLQSVANSADPCIWAQWLWVPGNNARAALAVYQSQGLGAWTTYNDGRWVAYLPQARAAWNAATSAPSGGTTTTSTLGQVLRSPGVSFGTLLALLVGGVLVAGGEAER